MYCSYRKPLLCTLILPRDLCNWFFIWPKKTSSSSGLFVLFSLALTLYCQRASWFPGPVVPHILILLEEASLSLLCLSIQKKTKKVHMACALPSLLLWMIERLGLRSALWSAFCLQSRNSLEYKFVFYWSGWTVLVFPEENQRRNEENNIEFPHCNRSVRLLWEKSVSFITCKIIMWKDSISTKL